jgi:hypothetical protein
MIRINCSPKSAVVCLLILVAAIVCNAQESTPAPAAAPSPAAAASPAATEPAAATKSSKGRIYFYRIKQFTGSALEPSVFCDDKELARMDNGRYFAVDLEPGEHTCRMGDKQTGFLLDVKAGEEYYAKVTLEAGFWKGHGRLTLLQKEQGAFEMKKVKPLDANKVKDRSLVSVYEGSETKP